MEVDKNKIMKNIDVFVRSAVEYAVDDVLYKTDVVHSNVRVEVCSVVRSDVNSTIDFKINSVIRSAINEEINNRR
jgi:hypothetical protein